ncbi:MAG: sarcosine oxidase subunit gamma family protein [Steroidobacteraceae bacterium]
MTDRIASLVPQSAMPAGGRVYGDALSLAVLPARTVIALRLATHTPKIVSAMRIAGRSLPETPNTWSGDDPVICRTAPDTWLLLSSLHEAAELLDAARTGCGRKACAITDLSDAHVTLALDGPRAADLLARGCGLDFAATAFGLQACTRTRLAQVPVILRRPTNERFECVVDRSVGQWLFDWMQDAAAGLD